MQQDVFSIVRAPFSLDRDQTLQVIGASGLVVGIMAGLDRPAARRVPSETETTLSSVATPASAPGRLYDQIGPDRFVLGAIGTFAVTGIALQEKQFTRTSFNLVEALALTKVTTGLFKGLAGRTRPYADSSPWELNVAKFGSAHATKSMPSGHTSRAFAIASVIAHDYDHWWVQIPAYGVATSVGVQRIRSGNHWLSDVVLGGALGYLIGRTVSDNKPAKDGSVSYDPIVGSNQLGLRVRF
ncbi:phosphatase PAP2 family protein [Longibacter salinarum]|uniref:phosphatase PAP2 family protein n=1 Tax=Longibacter salinarum TaxID=1850348 RepID=UPI0015CF21FE|nr:phosphatase PAP2 family protein [Longibacter salinarum]